MTTAAQGRSVVRRRIPLHHQQAHAAGLKTGMAVIVTDDNGKEHSATTDGEPWLLGGHTYVVNCDGLDRRFQAYNVMRVRPA